MSKKRNNTPNRPGRPAKPAYPKTREQCDHSGGKWDIGAGVITAWNFDPELGVEKDPDREVQGYCLVVNRLTCLECGQPFRFYGAPTKGNCLTHTVMVNRQSQLQQPVEPDTLIQGATKGPSNLVGLDGRPLN